MFKNLNHKFVYNYPLIWNTKIVPFLLISIVIHLLFFSVGYQNAIVHSVQIHNYYNEESNATTINLFAILISILVFIIWCVLYFRNNGFKAFYPKTNYSLFKEWILILVICQINFSYALSVLIGANVQSRSVTTAKLALERCETISKASMFLEGSFKELNWKEDTINRNIVRVERDSFAFEGENYDLNSLMNKNLESLSFFDDKQDSLMRLQVQRWMKENNKVEIGTIFKAYFKIANEHELKSSISAEKWLVLVYDYPEFTKYYTVGKAEYELEYHYGNEIAGEVDIVEDQFLRDTASTSIR